MTEVDVLVIGAGPYGLAAARALRARGLSVLVLGRPMGFWRDHMPAGMLLRSGPDWHVDALGEFTFEAFCADPPDPTRRCTCAPPRRLTSCSRARA